jgi:hypothetical protein
MTRLNFVPNQHDVYQHFPVSDRVCYLIRDHQPDRTLDGLDRIAGTFSINSTRFQVYVLIGDNPWVENYLTGAFLGAYRDYITACAQVEQLIERAGQLIERVGQLRAISYFDVVNY